LTHKKSAKVEARREARRKEDVNAFRAYCRDSPPIINGKVDANTIILNVRKASDFPGLHFEYGGYGLAKGMMRTRRPSCNASQTVIFEEKFKKSGKCDSESCDIEIRHHFACEQKEFEVVDEPVAKYEIVFGETTERRKTPLGSNMSRTSVRIVDISTARVLGEDSIYFYGDRAGEGGCTDAEQKISGLIAAVFPAH